MTPPDQRRRRVSSRDLPSIPTGLASLTLRALGGPNTNGGAQPIGPLTEQDLYRLEQLELFLASADRGTKGLRDLAASRAALAATPARGRRARYPTMSQDVATGELVKALLRTEDGAKVTELLTGLRDLRERLTQEPEADLPPPHRVYLDKYLKPFLYRLSRAEDRRRYESSPGRHVLRA